MASESDGVVADAAFDCPEIPPFWDDWDSCDVWEDDRACSLVLVCCASSLLPLP